MKMIDVKSSYVQKTWIINGVTDRFCRPALLKYSNEDFSTRESIRQIQLVPFDRYGYDYVLTITTGKVSECNDELMAQISDGLFENYNITSIKLKGLTVVYGE